MTYYVFKCVATVFMKSPITAQSGPGLLKYLLPSMGDHWACALITVEEFVIGTN